MDKNHLHLAQAWKNYYFASDRFGIGSPEAEEMWWAYEKMEQLIEHEPSIALDVVLEILRIADEESLKFDLAAGPLETLLVKHGRAVVDRVIGLAESDLSFRDLLQRVWGNSIDEGVWKRIQTLYIEKESKGATEQSNESNGPGSQ